jgi:hypothetical protein
MLIRFCKASSGLLIALWVFSSAAHAQQCRDLDTLQARSLKIGELAGAFEKWLSKIEGVPSADSTYIEIETREAARQKNYARYETVARHPFFHAHEVQKRYKVVKDNLEVARVPDSVGDQAVSLSTVLSEIAALAAALNEYQAFDARRPNPNFSQSECDSISIGLAFSRTWFLDMAQCAIRQMREP